MPWRINVRDIGPMVINLRRNRGFWLRDPLEQEVFMLSALRRLVSPDNVVFDVGANVGLYVRALIQQCKAKKVIAFEPATENRAYLERNIRLGNCQDRVQVVSVALADYDGMDEFQVDDVSSTSGVLNIVTQGKASISRRRFGFPPKTETVTVARLDTLVESGALPVPQVIKLDVEGAEERVLRGAARTLERHAPLLVIELHGAEVSHGVVRLLLDGAYSVFGLFTSEKEYSYRQVLRSDIGKITTENSLRYCVAGRDLRLLADAFT